MKSVKSYYQYAEERYGHEVAGKFLRLMEEWDGGPSVILAHYDEVVLKIKLNEAKGK